MKYDINIMPEAIQRIEAQARYIAIEKSEPQNAEAWLEAVYDAIAGDKTGTRGHETGVP